MKTLHASLCASLALACIAMAQDAMTPADVIQQVAECMRKGGDLAERSAKATGELQLKQQVAEQTVNEYGKPYNAERVQELERRAKQQKEYLARTEAELAAARVESAADRAAKKAEAALQAKEARKAYRDAATPFQQERAAALQESQALGTALEALMEGVALAPKELGVAEVKLNSNVSDGFVGLSWRDAGGKRLAWAHMRLKPVPAEIHEQGKLAGKYPVHGLSDSSAWFWAGGVNVAFVVQKAEWRGREKILEIAAKLIDPSALAALPKIEDAE